MTRTPETILEDVVKAVVEHRLALEAYDVFPSESYYVDMVLARKTVEIYKQELLDTIKTLTEKETK